MRHHELAVAPDVDALFEQEWIRSIFSLAPDELRAACEASGVRYGKPAARRAPLP